MHFSFTKLDQDQKSSDERGSSSQNTKCSMMLQKHTTNHRFLLFLVGLTATVSTFQVGWLLDECRQIESFLLVAYPEITWATRFNLYFPTSFGLCIGCVLCGFLLALPRKLIPLRPLLLISSALASLCIILKLLAFSLLPFKLSLYVVSNSFMSIFIGINFILFFRILQDNVPKRDQQNYATSVYIGLLAGMSMSNFIGSLIHSHMVQKVSQSSILEATGGLTDLTANSQIAYFLVPFFCCVIAVVLITLYQTHISLTSLMQEEGHFQRAYLLIQKIYNNIEDENNAQQMMTNVLKVEQDLFLITENLSLVTSLLSPKYNRSVVINLILGFITASNGGVSL